MAGDSYFGDAALGYIAGAISGKLNGDTAIAMAEIFERRFGRQEPELDVDAVIFRYNQLVHEFNRVVGVAKQWMAWGEDRKSEIAQLKRDLAAAKTRAEATEGREAALQESKRLADQELAVTAQAYGFAQDRIERLQTQYDNLAWEMKKLKGDAL